MNKSNNSKLITDFISQEDKLHADELKFLKHLFILVQQCRISVAYNEDVVGSDEDTDKLDNINNELRERIKKIE